MWIVYNREDSSDCGWEVGTEAEAIRQCKEDDNLNYVWKSSARDCCGCSSYYDYYDYYY